MEKTATAGCSPYSDVAAYAHSGCCIPSPAVGKFCIPYSPVSFRSISSNRLNQKFFSFPVFTGQEIPIVFILWQTGVFLVCLLVMFAGFFLIFLSTASWCFAQEQGTPTLADESVDEQHLLQYPEKIPTLVREGKLAVQQIPDPHWRQEACEACHRGKPAGGRSQLRHQSISRLCNTCHTAIATHANIHPVGVSPSRKMRKTMSVRFRKATDRNSNLVTCTSCHDVLMQCKSERFDERGMNPKFLLGGPYRSRSGICYQCHDKQAYQRLNAHDQITDQGRLLKHKCLLCHRAVPEQLPDGRVVNGGLHVNKELESLCLNCHPSRPHPGGDLPFMDKGGPNHLVVPSVTVLDRMAMMQGRNQVILPREPETGRQYCGTCHNPHERGVVKNIRLAKGADKKIRLRTGDICLNCHDI